MLEPVSRAEFVPSEQEKFNAAFSYAPSYASILGLAIRMVHLHENRSDNATEASIKNVLQRALKLTSVEEQHNEQRAFNRYLTQYILFEALQAICETYSKGINESIKTGLTFFFVPDDLFTIGNSLLNSLLSFTPVRRPNGKEEISNSQANFFQE